MNTQDKMITIQILQKEAIDAWNAAVQSGDEEEKQEAKERLDWLNGHPIDEILRDEGYM